MGIGLAITQPSGAGGAGEERKRGTKREKREKRRDRERREEGNENGERETRKEKREEGREKPREKEYGRKTQGKEGKGTQKLRRGFHNIHGPSWTQRMHLIISN